MAGKILPDGTLPDGMLPDEILPDGILPDRIQPDGRLIGSTGIKTEGGRRHLAGNYRFARLWKRRCVYGHMGYFILGASATVVGLLIWVVKLIFHDKLDARWHYFIWLVLGVRLLVPTDVAWVRTPVSILQAVPVVRWVKMVSLAVEDLCPEGMSQGLLAGYLAGMAVLGAYYLILWLAVCIRVHGAPKASRELVVQVEAIASKRGLASCKDIRVLPGKTPYIFGLLHPVLVLPGDWEELEESVILHELLHRKYRDVAVNLLLHIVGVLNWYNPLLWMITSAIQNDGEALCDERVLERLIHRKEADIPAGREGSDQEEEIAYGYGKTLLSLAADRKGLPKGLGSSAADNGFSDDTL